MIDTASMKMKLGILRKEIKGKRNPEGESETILSERRLCDQGLSSDAGFCFPQEQH